VHTLALGYRETEHIKRHIDTIAARRELVGGTESVLQRRSTRCRDHASINDKVSASCIAAAIAGEEEACRGDVLRPPSALKWDTTGSVADTPSEVEDLITHF